MRKKTSAPKIGTAAQKKIPTTHETQNPTTRPRIDKKQYAREVIALRLLSLLIILAICFIIWSYSEQLNVTIE